MLRESPIIGLGYYSASRVLGPQYNPGLGNAHSAFVEILVGGGLLGGTLFFLLYAVLIGYAGKLLLIRRDDPLAFAVVGLFAITFVMSTTVTDGIQSGPVGFTFWSVTALLPAVLDHGRRGRKALTSPEPEYLIRT
jgi:O-antigen ligase